MLALVHPVLAKGRAGVGGDVLEAGRIRGWRQHDRGVLKRARVLERLAHRGDRRSLLPDCHVDAPDLLGRVARVPVLLLVQDRVDGNGRLAGLPVADDQLALATTARPRPADPLTPGPTLL